MAEEPKLTNDLIRYINEVIFVIEQGGCDEHGIDFANFRLEYLSITLILNSQTLLFTKYKTMVIPNIEIILFLNVSTTLKSSSGVD